MSIMWTTSTGLQQRVEELEAENYRLRSEIQNLRAERYIAHQKLAEVEVLTRNQYQYAAEISESSQD